jgi:hypothetical protein
MFGRINFGNLSGEYKTEVSYYDNWSIVNRQRLCHRPQDHQTNAEGEVMSGGLTFGGVIAAALCALTNVASAEEKVTHVMMGAGAEECAHITEMYQSAKSPAAITALDIMVGAWVGGFMTAANYYRATGGEHMKDLSSSSMEQEIIAIRRYCKQHPDKLMMLGVATVFSGLSDQE